MNLLITLAPLIILAVGFAAFLCYAYRQCCKDDERRRELLRQIDERSAERHRQLRKEADEAREAHRIAVADYCRAIDRLSMAVDRFSEKHSR